MEGFFLLSPSALQTWRFGFLSHSQSFTVAFRHIMDTSGQDWAESQLVAHQKWLCFLIQTPIALISSEMPEAALSNPPKQLQGGHVAAHVTMSLSLYCVHKDTELLVSLHDHWPQVKTIRSRRAACVITCMLSVGRSWFRPQTHTQAQRAVKNGFGSTKLC